MTAEELAVFLGITPGAVRQIISRNRIQHTAKRGKAKVYDPRDIFAVAGTHDRRTP